MANRIRGSVLIIDSASIAVNFPGATQSAKVSAIAFWSSNSTGAFQLSFAQNTADIIVNMASPVNQANMTTLKLAEDTYFQNLYVNTVTAGTGYLYLA